MASPSPGKGEFSTPLIKEIVQASLEGKTVLNESLDEKILGLYALGMSVQDIANHMDEV